MVNSRVEGPFGEMARKAAHPSDCLGCYIPLDENHTKRFSLKECEHKVEMDLIAIDFTKAAEWIETQTKTPAWSVCHHVSRNDRTGYFVFSFSCQESAALFKLMFLG